MADLASICMRKHLNEDTLVPLATGYVFATFDPQQHAQDARRLLNAAYANGEGTVIEFEKWWCPLIADPEYDPYLVFVIEETSSSAMAAFAQCWDSAFIKDLAVAESHRRQGLGAALLSRIFHCFKARGSSTVSLKVTAENRSGAFELYRAAGMEPD